MSKLIFVYNAKSDIINSTFDFAHKIISPKTYSCSLCKLTHGNFGESKIWKEFRENSNLEMEFLHKDEFEDNYTERDGYPIVYEAVDKELEIKLSPEELSKIESIVELKSFIDSI